MKIARRIILVLAVVAMLVAGLVIPASAAENGTWELVTDASTLQAGDKIVIAESTKAVVAGNISNQIMGNEAATFSSDKKTISTLPEGAVVLTLGGTSGAWTLSNSAGNLLGATAVKKLAWGSGTTTWSISIDASNNATIQNGTESYGRFLYNSSSPRFTTYTSNASASMLLPQIYKFVEADTCTHESTTLTDAKDETCTEAGNSAYWTCLDCEKYFSDVACTEEIEKDSWIIPALGHTEVIDEAKAPTCTETGLTEGKHCSVCNEVLVAQETVNVLDHDYGNDNVCDSCGYVNACTHEGKLTEYEAKAPTCTENGWNAYVACSGCDYTTYEEIPATGHSLVTDAAVAPTCVATGLTAGEHCSVCDYKVAQTVVPATGVHTYVDGACSVCGDAPKTVKVNVQDYATANSWGNGTKYNTLVIDDNITATATGGTNTGKYYTSGNEWRLYQSESATLTITAANNCTIVSVKITYNISNTGVLQLNLNSSNVTSGTVVDVNAASITFNLGNTGTATNGQVKITAIEVVYATPKCEHKTTTTTNTATCTEAGYIIVTCDDCEKEISKVETTALGHTEVIDAAVNATCTETGLTEGKHCSVCNEVLVAQEEVAAFGHNYVDDKCTVCGVSNPDACTHESTTTTNTATCTEAGYIIVTCDDCEKEISKVETTALGHTKVIDEAVSATCTTTGLTEGKHCSVCNEVLVAQETIAATGIHNYYNNKCSTCGENPVPTPESWVEVELAEITDTDVIVIVWKNASGTSYAMTNNNGTSAPSAVEVTISGTQLTGVADNISWNDILWNITNNEGTLTIYPNGTTETWLYCTSANNGVRVGTNDDKTFKIDATTGYLQHEGTSRYLGVYNAQDIRCYTNTTGNTANQTIVFYKKVDAVNPPKLGVSLNIGSDLDIKVHATLPEGATIKNMTFGGVEAIGENNVFTYEGITPNELAKRVTIKCVVEYNGNTYTFEKKYSILDYCEAYASRDNAEMKELLAALMVYGDATRAFNSTEENPLPPTATALLEGAYADYVKAYDFNAEDYSDYTSENYLEVFKSATLVLNNKVDVRFTLNQLLPEGATVEAWIGGMSNDEWKVGYTLGTVTVVEEEVKYQTITVTDVMATEFDKEVVVKITVGENVYVMYYSVNTYCVAMANDTDAGALAQAIYNYGKAAEAYVATKSN